MMERRRYNRGHCQGLGMTKLSRQGQTCGHFFSGLIGVTKLQKGQGSKALEHYFAIEARKNAVAVAVMCGVKRRPLFKVL